MGACITSHTTNPIIMKNPMLYSRNGTRSPAAFAYPTALTEPLASVPYIMVVEAVSNKGAVALIIMNMGCMIMTNAKMKIKVPIIIL